MLAVGGLLVCFALLLFHARKKQVALAKTFAAGAFEGLETVWRLLPYLLLMLVAISLLRASGALDDLAHCLAPVLKRFGIPAEIVPLALLRPFSGSGSNALFIDLIHQQGPDSSLALLAGSLIGSTETTFYVATLYFGSVGVKQTRYAIPVGLWADLCALLGALWMYTHY